MAKEIEENKEKKVVEDYDKLTKRQLIDEIERLLLVEVVTDNTLAEKRKECNDVKAENQHLRRKLAMAQADLDDALDEQQRQVEAAENCTQMMKDFLFCFLSNKNAARVKRMLRFYDNLSQTRMMNALLCYLLFGKKPQFEREVEAWHFRVICEKIDEDAITLPAHSLMVRLIQKYGLF